MPPRFSKSIIAMLKAALRARASEGYRFSEGDVAELVGRTGLDAAQIRQWNVKANHYYTTNEAKEAFLAGDEKVKRSVAFNRWLATKVAKLIIHITLKYYNSPRTSRPRTTRSSLGASMATLRRTRSSSRRGCAS